MLVILLYWFAAQQETSTYRDPKYGFSLHKKWSSPLWISQVNVTKSEDTWNTR